MAWRIEWKTVVGSLKLFGITFFYFFSIYYAQVYDLVLSLKFNILLSWQTVYSVIEILRDYIKYLSQYTTVWVNEVTKNLLTSPSVHLLYIQIHVRSNVWGWYDF